MKCCFTECYGHDSSGIGTRLVLSALSEAINVDYSGGIISTSGDMAKFMMAVIDALNGEDGALLSTWVILYDVAKTTINF